MIQCRELNIIQGPTPRIIRSAKWLCRLALGIILFAIGVSCGVVIGGYRGQVADENFAAWGRRVDVLEREFEKRFPRQLVTTKAVAQVISQRLLDARGGKLE